nr:homolog of EHV2 ORF10 protein G10 [Macronycteris gammaherpesvirus 1]
MALSVPLNTRLNMNDGRDGFNGHNAWSFTYTNKGFLFANECSLTPKRMEAFTLQLPWSVWDLGGFLASTFTQKRSEVKNLFFDAVFAVGNDNDHNDGVHVLQSFISNLKEEISITVVSKRNLILPGHLKFYVFPLYSHADNRLCTPVLHSYSANPISEANLALTERGIGSTIITAKGLACKDSEGFYKLYFKWNNQSPFYHITDTYIYSNTYETNKKIFGESEPVVSRLNMSILYRQLKRWQHDLYCLELAAVGDNLPESIYVKAHIGFISERPDFCMDKNIPSYFNLSWGWSIPFYSPISISLHPGERKLLPVHGMYMTIVSNMFCLIAGVSSNTNYVVEAEVVYSMRSITLKLFNHSNDLVEIKAGSLVALGIVAFKYYNSKQSEIKYSDRDHKLFSWDDYSLENLKHTREPPSPAHTKSESSSEEEIEDCKEESVTANPTIAANSESFTEEDCMLMEDSQIY